VDWSLFGCGRSGHLTFAPDEPDLRMEMGAGLPGEQAWQCLRCGTYVAGPPAQSGPAGTAPVVLRGTEIRGKLILRLFAIERFLRALIFGAAAYGLWRFRFARTSIEQAFDRELPVIRGLFRQLGYNIDHSKLVGLVQHALTLSSKSLTLLALGVGAYALIALVEGTGLWLAKRWGEYFAMIATSIGLPLEIYDLTKKITATAAVLLVVNLALVIYLIATKRLLGVRGGKRAYDARLRSESVLEAAERAAASRSSTGPGGGATAVEPGGATAIEPRGSDVVESGDGDADEPRRSAAVESGGGDADEPRGSAPAGVAGGDVIKSGGRTAAEPLRPNIPS
jgi:uncharacterized membrane protein (DUF2068 family)